MEAAFGYDIQRVAAVQRMVKVKSPAATYTNNPNTTKKLPIEVASDVGFTKLVEDGFTYEFADLNELKEVLGGWKDKQVIPPDMKKWVKEFECTYSAREAQEKQPVSVSLENCGNTTHHVVGRINDASGAQVKRYFKKDYYGTQAKEFFDEIVADEGFPALIRVVVDTGVHEFTLEKLGTQVVMQQGYQTHFSAIWWATESIPYRGQDSDMEKKRARFGGGKVIQAAEIAGLMSEFLACGLYHNEQALAKWAALPFPQKDQQMRDLCTGKETKEKKIYLTIEKFRVPPEAEKMPGEDKFLTNRVMAEAKGLK